MPVLRDINVPRTAFLLSLPFLLYLILPASCIVPILKVLKFLAALHIILIWLVKAFYPLDWLYRVSDQERFRLPPAPYEPFPVAAD